MSFNNSNEHTSLVISSSPAIEPVTINEAKEQLRVTHSAHNAVITELIKAVRANLERTLNRALITQTWKAYYANWPSNDYLIIPRAPLQSITSIKYTDYEGTVATLGSSNYIVDIKNQPGRAILGYGISWPTATLYPSNPIEVIFIAGYGSAATAVPEELKIMLKLGVERLYAKPPDQYDKLLTSFFNDYLLNYRAF